MYRLAPKQIVTLNRKPINGFQLNLKCTKTCGHITSFNIYIYIYIRGIYIALGTCVSERESSIYSELTQQKMVLTKALTSKKEKHKSLLCGQSVLSVCLTTLIIIKKDGIYILPHIYIYIYIYI